MAPHLPTILVRVSVIILWSRSISQTSGSKQKTKIKGLQFRLIHIDSPESPVYQPNLTNLERKKRLLAMSNYRMYHITKNITQLSISRTIHNEPDVISPQLQINGAAFFVEIGLGQFVNGASHSAYLYFDTGGEDIWAECEGCSPCTQNVPLFSWRTSSPYHILEYNECPPGRWNHQHGLCMSEITYEDGGRMKGVMAREKFAFTNSFSGTSQSINGLIFTCGIEMHDLSYGLMVGNKVNGVLGMGSGPLSLISQLGNVAYHQFSYCLQDVTITDGQAFPTFLRFGEYIRRLPLMSVTPFETPPGHFGYYVRLTDISVNGRRLNIPQHLFDFKADKSGGTVIDSGSTLTHIHSDAYDMLVAAITSYVLDNNSFLRKHLNPIGLNLEDCLEPIFNSATAIFPTLAFHFLDDADMLVQPKLMFQAYPLSGVPFPGMYCLTMKRTYDVNVIGNFVQANKLLIYDLRASTISFVATDCSHQG